MSDEFQQWVDEHAELEGAWPGLGLLLTLFVAGVVIWALVS